MEFPAVSERLCDRKAVVQFPRRRVRIVLGIVGLSIGGDCIDRFRTRVSYRRVAGSDAASGVAGMSDIMNDRLTTILAELRRRLELLHGTRIAQMMLFGSKVRGDAEPGSDIDILVVLRDRVSPCEEIARPIADVWLHDNEVVYCI